MAYYGDLEVAQVAKAYAKVMTAYQRFVIDSDIASQERLKSDVRDLAEIVTLKTESGLELEKVLAIFNARSLHEV